VIALTTGPFGEGSGEGSDGVSFFLHPKFRIAIGNRSLVINDGIDLITPSLSVAKLNELLLYIV
jgi:hypothetical protein